MPARITGTAPADTGGSPITGYQLEVSRQGGAYSLLATDLPALDYSDPAAAYGDAYRWRAKNTLGYGQPGAVGVHVDPGTGGSGDIAHGLDVNATNTGRQAGAPALTDLTVPGFQWNPGNGVVLENRRIIMSAGYTVMQSSSVTLQNCQIDGGLVFGNASDGSLMEFCRVSAGVAFSSADTVTVQRCHVTSTGSDIFKVTSDTGSRCQNITLRQNYGVGTYTAGSSAHLDGLQISGGANVLVEDNYIDLGPFENDPAGGDNAAIFIKDEGQGFGISGVTVRRNALRAGRITFRLGTGVVSATDNVFLPAAGVDTYVAFDSVPNPAPVWTNNRESSLTGPIVPYPTA